MKRSKHSLSKYKLMSCLPGYINPIALTEVLPGDTIQQASNILLRVTPLLAPVMHPVHVAVHHWFVPHRLVWDNWENFITGGAYGSTPPVFPTINVSGGGSPIPNGTLPDFLDIPTGTNTPNSQTVSALPFRGYNLIFNEWYRDQDLVSAMAISTGDGTDSTTNVNLLRAAWNKDYFTMARPWAQKGDNVSVPVTMGETPFSGQQIRDVNGNLFPGAEGLQRGGGGSSWFEDASGDKQILDPNGSMVIDLEDLVLARALKRYEEARALYGSRYTEYLRSLGVRSSDARLQRPEYLGGGKQTIQFSEVLQTGVTTDGDDTEGVGNLKGHGIGSLRSNRFRRFFEEHGYIFSFLIIKPISVYTQGRPRHWDYRTKEDFYQRELEDVGPQEIKKEEVYVSTADPGGTWGYAPRYDHLRTGMSTVSGDFRDSLDFWHYARKFGASEPTLNGSFVTCQPTDRVYAVSESAANSMWVMAYHSIQARRIIKPRAGVSILK